MTGVPPKRKTSFRFFRPRTKKRLRFATALGLWGFAAALTMLAYFIYDLPGTDAIKPIDRTPSITILANDGTMLARYGGVQGQVLSVSDLPVYVPAAVLAIEDRRFYGHVGVDPLGLARAMWVNIREGAFKQGGSTITQQLAKNLFLTADKTLRRKVQEAILALLIDWRFDKDQILSAYLNRVYFGAGAYGIDAAARTYFDKPATELNLWEGAVLAGLLKAPSRYSPSSNPDLAKKRALVVLTAMRDAGYITSDQEKAEVKAAVLRRPGRSDVVSARYFTDWVINQIDSFVAYSEKDIVVQTTMDPRLQKAAEEHMQAVMLTATQEAKIGQAALVTLQRDGAVLAMIGGRDYNTSQFNRATTAARQPGSSFKPFVYLAALEAGYATDTTIEDAPITTGSYRPKNYDDKYFGTVTLADALALSLNTATVRLLADVGVGRLLDVVQRLGFTAAFKPELATGLGAGEASVLEMTNAYAVISSGGRAIWPYAVVSVADSDGVILYAHQAVPQAALFQSRDVAALDDMLQGVVAHGTGQAAAIPGVTVAGKTGTSQNYRDAWFIGYARGLVTGVWMGNDDNAPMNKVTGGRFPARLFAAYMTDALTFDVPELAALLPQAVPQEDGFFSLLNRWSSGENLAPERGSRFSTPVYNR